MAIRGFAFVTIALFVGISALVLHLSALCSPHWKITKRDQPPIMAPVSYGIWERCEYTNITVIKQGITIGTRTNVQFCYPNLYMRYSPDHYNSCRNFRRRCSVLGKDQLPEGCSCRYLPSAKALQWLTVLAAVFLILGLLLLYLKSITSPENTSASFVLGYGPFICFLLALLLMVTGLILLGAYLRRDTYEDYSFPLQSLHDNQVHDTYNLHALRNYAKSDAKVSHERYVEAERELRTDANTHYHTIIGRATAYEIIATVLVLINTVLTFWLGTTARSEDKI